MIIPESFIKNVAIQLHEDFSFENSPYNKEGNFIGRDKLEKKFLEFLKSKEKKGVFLVTGFRGMGKTSFVNKVLEEYDKKKNRKPHRINLTISQTLPTEIDILRLMVSGVYDKYMEVCGEKDKKK